MASQSWVFQAQEIMLKCAAAVENVTEAQNYERHYNDGKLYSENQSAWDGYQHTLSHLSEVVASALNECHAKDDRETGQVWVVQYAVFSTATGKTAWKTVSIPGANNYIPRTWYLEAAAIEYAKSSSAGGVTTRVCRQIAKNELEPHHIAIGGEVFALSYANRNIEV